MRLAQATTAVKTDAVAHFGRPTDRMTQLHDTSTPRPYSVFNLTGASEADFQGAMSASNNEAL